MSKFLDDLGYQDTHEGTSDVLNPLWFIVGVSAIGGALLMSPSRTAHHLGTFLFLLLFTVVIGMGVGAIVRWLRK